MTTEQKTYWVEVLCDGGHMHGAAVEAYSIEEAGEEGFANASGDAWKLRPIRIDTISDNDTGEVLFDEKNFSYDDVPRSTLIRFGIITPEPRYRPLTNGKLKDTLTGEAVEPVTARKDEHPDHTPPWMTKI